MAVSLAVRMGARCYTARCRNLQEPTHATWSNWETSPNGCHTTDHAPQTWWSISSGRAFRYLVCLSNFNGCDHFQGSRSCAIPLADTFSDCLKCGEVLAYVLVLCCMQASAFEGVTEVCVCLQATELPVLDEDRQLDAESTNAGQQQFEKLTAGLYMGDIARRIMLRCSLLCLCSAC